MDVSHEALGDYGLRVCAVFVVTIGVMNGVFGMGCDVCVVNVR